MKKIIIALSATALAIGLMGCASVPKTQIAFNPKTGALSIKSPKNVSIESVEVEQGTNGFKLTAKGYSSTNDNNVVAAVAQANAATAAAVTAAGQKALETAVATAK